ncbi:MAG: hypothetical protein M3220_10235 [Chloroflexota bacterium]|nr:hypothetical protein [Chloroflexota bacterium]
MPSSRNIALWTGLTAFVAGLLGVFLLMGSSDWGPPGTAAYRFYETRNRLVPLPLLLVAVGLITLYVRWRDVVGRLGRVAFVIALIGTGLMIIGNVAEFWFFTEYPYGEINPRSHAWLIFLLGLLALVVGSLLYGIAVLRRMER